MIIPKKSLGQNFLIDKNISKKIVNSTLIKNQNIIEIGPGLGSLTDLIINMKPRSITLIEKDKQLIEILKKKYVKNKIRIINADALKYNFNIHNKSKIISNLPYNISSKLITKILTTENFILEILCMIQTELADKYNYNKGKMNKYKFLSQKFGKFEVKFNVSANVFYPKPKVKSTVVLFKRNKNIDKDQERLKYFFNFFFINKRKKIKSNKYFKNNISNKYLNYRYEELNYQSLLDIYHRFKLPVS